MRVNRRCARVLSAVVAAAMLLPLNACGTILHPERIGQRGGRIDPAIAILDAAGLLLFLIPGVVAFAVDFTNGTIYLPPDCAYGSVGDASEKKLVAIRFAPHELTPDRIEQVVGERIGQPIDLETDPVRVRQLENLEHFEADYATFVAQPEAAPPARVLFK